MDAIWARKLWETQRQETILIAGEEFKRIRYGREGRRWHYGIPVCHDCGARMGQFHGPGCDMERCPACRGQLLSCWCARPEEPPEVCEKGEGGANPAKAFRNRLEELASRLLQTKPTDEGRD